ncbi:hypothetical protein [Scytonema sp. UIC 10036]|uniref:hypothetical protein n=1 Tax=Scytonema sp. UIC 10036 TaxID=2304196 RepID=UPI001FA94906|nr:hypothetical protein [Scytonema sp. UIC 10036]
MYLLDTDTLTHLYSGRLSVVERLRAVEDPDVGITIITKFEVLRGRLDYLLKAETAMDVLKAQELLFRTEDLLNHLLHFWVYILGEWVLASEVSKLVCFKFTFSQVVKDLILTGLTQPQPYFKDFTFLNNIFCRVDSDRL